MKYRSYLFVIAIAALAFTACKKEGDILPVKTSQAAVNFVNAGTDTINFFLNGTRLNKTSFYFPGGNLGYYSVADGEQSYQIKKAGTTTVLFDAKYTLRPGGLYSLFAAGSSADRIFLMADSIRNDSLALTLAQVRFVNASPETNYDVKVGSGFAQTNRVFKSATRFTTVTAGNNVMTVSLAGSTTPLVTRTLNLAAGKAYTIYTKGKVGGIDAAAFGAVVITNL